MYALLAVQLLVFAFATFNWGPFVFTPLLEKFNPAILAAIQGLDPKYPLIWNIRGVLGLVVSISIGIFLIALAKPAVFEKLFKKLPRAMKQEKPALPK